MKYKDKLKESMTWLSKKDEVVFIGEGLINAGRIYGTLDDVPSGKCIEMPICENLIVGCAIGLAIRGYHPVVVFQRMDFMLLASDQIINHMALMQRMSGGLVTLPIIIRAIIGSRDPKFDVGPQHNHDLTHIFEPYLATYRIDEDHCNPDIYKTVNEAMTKPALIVEDRDLYEVDVDLYEGDFDLYEGGNQ